MNKKLYVGNLNYKATQEDLRKLFTEVGKAVAVNVIMDRETGRSKGFAFVEMESEEEAQEAIERLNNRQFQGRALRVSEAQPPRDRSSMPPRREQRGPSQRPDQRRR
jgi:RNA recognition motif-containing protein